MTLKSIPKFLTTKEFKQETADVDKYRPIDKEEFKRLFDEYLSQCTLRLKGTADASVDRDIPFNKYLDYK